MNKILSQILVFVLMLSLAACGADNQAEVSAQPGEIATPEANITPVEPEASQETEPANEPEATDETQSPDQVIIGKWVLTITTPDGVKSVQTLQFAEDGTGSYLLEETDANGQQLDGNQYDFTWTYENGEYTCVNKKYTDTYFIDDETGALIDRNSQGRKFKFVNE